jgi:riboflavin kinase/FMN adenylyltransferase
MSPEAFVEKILVKKFRVLEVCMGYDAHFGYHRRGTPDRMRQFAKEYDFLFRRMKPVRIGKRPVSSTLIRKFLAEGKIEKIQDCLGRPFSLFGRVVKGKGHGSHLGFPTANLEIHANIQIPLGVYVASARFLPASLARLGVGRGKLDRYDGSKTGPWVSGVMNYGKRPTYPAFETPRPLLEMHLFDFHENVYGEFMEIALHKFIRKEKRFESEENLKNQIISDVRLAQRWHSKKYFR